MAMSFGTVQCSNDVWCDNLVEIPYDAAALSGDLLYEELLCDDCYDEWSSLNWVIGEES